ncbi:hypothetical protein CLF_109191 [Clonorchis sinensis]|uniref:Uncharacterized protein n=1 Tax=Clonorchis sinensis TaxID=79923 RepID=G7YSC9_CLOSI|nr:hypothetical protein CLF_109191 [Clonorchis sinensis]
MIRAATNKCYEGVIPKAKCGIKHGSPQKLLSRCKQCSGCMRKVNKCQYIRLTSGRFASCSTAQSLARSLERKLGL